MNSAMHQMDHTTQQNAAKVQDTTFASHALEEEAQALRVLVSKLRFHERRSAPRVENMIRRTAA